MIYWLFDLPIGLPILAFIEWMRRRQPSRARSVKWRFIECLILACIITPVGIDVAFVPAIYMVYLGFPGLIGFLMSKGSDVEYMEFLMFLFGALSIAIASVVLCGAWSLVIFIRRRQKK